MITYDYSQCDDKFCSIASDFKSDEDGKWARDFTRDYWPKLKSAMCTKNKLVPVMEIRVKIGAKRTRREERTRWV